jgi:DNA repair exonuclease SbcCD ATPase subunit
MITFELIRWKNLLSTGNAWTEIELNANKTNLIVGANGHGKSTILDALTFVLFGKPFRKINKPMLVNSVNGKDCLVEIIFKAYGKDYKIVRGIKPNIFEIWVDGTLLNQDSASRDYQEYLEKFILKMNMKSFCQIVILGSASFTPFMQLTPADRRTIIEDLLDIQIFSVMNLLVKQRAQENKEKLENTRVVMRSTTEKKDYIEKTLASLRQTNDDRLAELEKQYQDLAQQKKDIISDVEKIVAEKKQLQDEVNDLSEIKKQFHDTVKLYTQFDTEAKRLDAEKEMLKTTDNCPTCKQTIEKSFKSQRVLDLGNTISGLVVQATVTEGQSNILLAEISNKENQVKRIQAISADISAKKQTMMHLVSTMNDIEDSIDKIKNADKLVQNSEEDLLKTVGEIERIEGVIKFQMTERVMIDTASALLKDGGIKTKIIKQYIPIINKLVNKYLDRMGFFVNFNIDENFNEVIKSRYRDEFAYANFSEGEKTRIDLALMFTWRSIAKMKNSVNTNLLILDEILDGSLDANGTDEFLKIIKTLTDDTNTYIISHKTDTIADKFDKTYRFEKIRNFSRLMT